MGKHRFSGEYWSVLAPDNNVYKTKSPTPIGAYSAICVGRLHLHPRVVAHVRDNSLIGIYVFRAEEYNAKNPKPRIEQLQPHIKNGYSREEQIRYLCNKISSQRSQARGAGSKKARNIEIISQLDNDTLGYMFTSAYLAENRMPCSSTDFSAVLTQQPLF